MPSFIGHRWQSIPPTEEDCWYLKTFTSPNNYSANWPDKRNLAWSSLLRARAIENQSYVLGVNCFGEDAWHNHYSGTSMAVSFDGELISELAKGEQIFHLDLDKNSLNEFRKAFPFLQDRDPIEFI